ncbi:MAG: rhodanese-like domain-containing protein [Lachnospiraceae bacterium]|nr:rhodanese-like domain-containing protein [Lachnospiraceae bacterium]
MLREEIRTIGVKDIQNFQNREDVLFIDVRDKEDYELYHIAGAKNFPYDDMELWEKRLDREKTYVLYCERGSLSMMAAKQLLQKGYSVCTLVGGIRAIQERNLD